MEWLQDGFLPWLDEWEKQAKARNDKEKEVMNIIWNQNDWYVWTVVHLLHTLHKIIIIESFIFSNSISQPILDLSHKIPD